jgi:zinc protease
VALLPNEATSVTETVLADAFVKGVEQVFPKEEPADQYLGAGATKVKDKPDAVRFDLAPGLRLVYRQNDDAQLFTVTAATEGGLRGETEADAGLYHAMSGLMGTATESLSYEGLVGVVENLGASLEGFSGKDSFGFHMQCLTEQAEQLLDLLVACLMTPVFPEEQWGAIKREIEQSIASQEDSPAGVCVRRFQEAIFGAHPYRHPLYGTKQSLPSFSPKSLLKAYVERRDGGPWVLAATGSLAPDKAAKRFETALKAFRPKAAKRRFTSDALISEPSPSRHEIPKEREQAHIVYGFKGLTWDDSDRTALDVMTNVLGGHGGRLFTNLRDRDSLAYTVSPIVSYGCHPGVLGSYIACAPAKVEQALLGLKNEMARIAETPASDAEVERSRNYIVGSHDMSLQRSDSQTSTMALMELYGYGFDDFLKYPKAIARVVPADVMRVARRLIDDKKAVTVVVGPKA